MFEIVLIAIIADPTAPVYSFQARRPPTRMPRGLSHCCNNFNAATAASFNPWRVSDSAGWYKRTWSLAHSVGSQRHNRAYRPQVARQRTFKTHHCYRSQELDRNRTRRQYHRAMRAGGAPHRRAPRAVEARSAELPTVRIIAARKIERPRQRRLVPAHAPARALHHAQRHRI